MHQASLPIPTLNARPFGARCLSALTDDALFDACGVRVAFTGRKGGFSLPPYDELNLGSHVGDDAGAVDRNRRLLAESLGYDNRLLVVPNQVHEDNVVVVESDSPAALAEARDRAQRGADALVVSAAGVPALLCFADCTPVVIVSPTRRFAVIHAGWRGVVNGVALRAAEQLLRLDGPGADASEYNVYFGPHIHGECFETGVDVRKVFQDRFGDGCLVGDSHVSMLDALRTDLASAGFSLDRIVDSGICTRCCSDEYYSYRASGGTCGRHAAVAFASRE